MSLEVMEFGVGGGRRWCRQDDGLVIKVATDIISGPDPAEIQPNFHIRPYLTPAGYGHRTWGRIWLSFDASASLCNWAGIHCL